jgi:hypothetical protein
MQPARANGHDESLHEITKVPIGMIGVSVCQNDREISNRQTKAAGPHLRDPTALVCLLAALGQPA